MEQRRFEVEITFRQTLRYAVEAESREAAERVVVERWQEGDEEGTVGSECCHLVEVRSAETPDEEHCTRDADQAFRYLRDRELVLEALSPDAFNPTLHDAVSAEEVAVHFDWYRRAGEGERIADVPRAARALERLCEDRRVVCFTRPRVRAGERGEVRLYSTPQHLERLSALVIPQEALSPPAEGAEADAASAGSAAS